jgi:DMSO/TMAO reductase YedYZ molybdopterin-dependent catalytic subunit
MTPSRPLTRRPFLAGAAAALVAPSFAHAGETVDLALPGGPSTRPLTTAYPQKGRMILQRGMAPLLETPFDVFDRGVFTPNDEFYVRWHWAAFPTAVDADKFRLNVHGAVKQPLSLSLADLVRGLPQVELAAVNQCSGNSRGFVLPRVTGAQWGNGAMGNAMWRGVQLRDVLDRAGVKPGATAVRFHGLDETTVPDAPRLRKSLSLDHARDGEVLIATAMNGADLPLLNGFPMRLIVPGWFATYWVKMLSDIEVLDAPDSDYWMATAYRIPDTPDGGIAPGSKGFPTRPIGPMVPRSFVTNLADGARVKAGKKLELRGIAFGGDAGVAGVDISLDGGARWQPVQLGPDQGKYGFRRWSMAIAPARGKVTVSVRCTNTAGLAQPARGVWNPGGYMHNAIEQITLEAA